jgi:hypothetical protein
LKIETADSGLHALFLTQFGLRDHGRVRSLSATTSQTWQVAGAFAPKR